MSDRVIAQSLNFPGKRRSSSTAVITLNSAMRERTLYIPISDTGVLGGSLLSLTPILTRTTLADCLIFSKGSQLTGWLILVFQHSQICIRDTTVLLPLFIYATIRFQQACVSLFRLSAILTCFRQCQGQNPIQRTMPLLSCALSAERTRCFLPAILNGRRSCAFEMPLIPLPRRS